MTIPPRVGDHLFVSEEVCRHAGILAKQRIEDTPMRWAQFERSGGIMVVTVADRHNFNGHFIDRSTGRPIPALNNDPAGWFVNARHWHGVTLVPRPVLIEEFDEPPFTGVIP